MPGSPWAVPLDHEIAGPTGAPVLLPGGYTVADLGHDVLALLDAPDIERASHCGLPLGGCCEAIRAVDLRDELPKISAHTLVIAGEPDPATPPERGAEIADAVCGARLTVVPGAHLANVESPARFTAALLGHLTG